MIRRPPRSTRTDTLFPYTTLFRSDDAVRQGDSFEFVSPNGQTVIFYDPPASRQKVAALRGPDLFADQKTIRLDDYTGQVVVINVWGSWCGPCRAEAPVLGELGRASGGKECVRTCSSRWSPYN